MPFNSGKGSVANVSAGWKDESGQKVTSAMDMHFPDCNVELSRSLMRALRHTGISLLYQDQSLRSYGRRTCRIVEHPRLTGLTDVDFLPAAEAAGCRRQEGRVSRRAGEPGNPDRRRRRGLLVRGIGRRRQVGRRQAEGRDHHGDRVTDRKRREQTLRALLREVSHRSKNLLAIIQSIATQTGRYSDSSTVSCRAFAAGCSRWPLRRIW